MELVKAYDPNSWRSNMPKIAVGIDFGTTNSLIAIISQDGKALVIPDKNGKKLVKSLLSYNDGELKIGNETNQIDCIRSIKRLVGKSFEEINNSSELSLIGQSIKSVSAKYCEKVLAPVEIVAHIFSYLIGMATDYLRSDIKDAVVTVPAHFGEIERRVIQDAAKIINLNVLRLINEPNSAAIAYGLHNSISNDEIHLVYDFGGGTFDVSLLRKNKGVFQVLASDGDLMLGGDDFDHALCDFLSLKYNLNCKRDDLLPIACQIKEWLTTNDKIQQIYCINGVECSIDISVQEFNHLIRNIVERTIKIVKNVMFLANMSVSKVQSVVMVGGSTKVPLVRDLVNKIFGADKVLCDIDPETIVVVGAAIQASSLTSNINNSILIDVLPLSLGIEIMGGLMDVVIERNTPLPISQSRTFTTFCDGQTVMKISVFQGERETIKNNKLLDCFELRNITPLAAGKAKIKITFTVDSSGLLSVQAMEDGGEAQKDINVHAMYGLSEKEIDKIISNSFLYASDDLKQRELIENKIEGESVIKAIKTVISCGKYKFTDDELYKLEKLSNDLSESLSSDISDDIESRIALLEKYFNPLIHVGIDKYIKKILINHDVNKYNE